MIIEHFVKGLAGGWVEVKDWPELKKTIPEAGRIYWTYLEKLNNGVKVRVRWP